jgi:hypothetical protein
MEKVRDENMPPLPDSFPAAIRQIVSRMLARQPEQRYHSCSAIIADLKAYEASA